MVTRVVNIRLGAAYDVYIGRRTRARPTSPWANPFRIGPDGDRSAVLARYRAWLATRPDLLARLPDLAGRVLGCWCVPEPCHGDILATLADRVAEGATLDGLLD